MQDKQLREATTQWVAALDVLRSEMPASESRSLIREVFAAFLLLRWADLQDAEQEAMAAFEDRTYQPLLPESLQWRHWVLLDHPRAIADRLQELLDRKLRSVSGTAYEVKGKLVRFGLSRGYDYDIVVEAASRAVARTGAEEEEE